MLETRTQGDICIIKILCEITRVNLEELKKKIHDSMQEEFKVYIFNLQNCTYINSGGFQYIVELYKELRKNNKKLALSNLIPDIKKLFEITKMDTIIDIYKTEKDALDKIK